MFGEDRVNFNKYFLANLEAYFQKYADENELNQKPEIEDPSEGTEKPEEGLEEPVEEPKEPEATEATEEEPEAL